MPVLCQRDASDARSDAWFRVSSMVSRAPECPVDAVVKPAGYYYRFWAVESEYAGYNCQKVATNFEEKRRKKKNYII